MGKLLKLRIWHEKRHPFSGWHLAKVRVICPAAPAATRPRIETCRGCPQVTLLKTLTVEKYRFPCGRWLDVNEDDGEILRELPAAGALVAEPLPRETPRVGPSAASAGRP